MLDEYSHLVLVVRLRLNVCQQYIVQTNNQMRDSSEDSLNSHFLVFFITHAKPALRAYRWHGC